MKKRRAFFIPPQGGTKNEIDKNRDEDCTRLTKDDISDYQTFFSSNPVIVTDSGRF
jgi:hypothetical protein